METKKTPHRDVHMTYQQARFEDAQAYGTNCGGDMDSFKAGFDAGRRHTLMSDEVRGLVEALSESLEHAEEYNDGCLYCGTPLSRVYDEHGIVLESHRKSCWHYSAKDTLANYSALMKEME